MNDAITQQTDGIAYVEFFERDTYAGSRRVYCCGATEAGVSFSAYWPHTAYFCPTCGELWGRAIYQYKFAYAPRIKGHWTVEKRPCVGCGDGQFLVGRESFDECSKELLTRELLALLEN